MRVHKNEVVNLSAMKGDVAVLMDMDAETTGNIMCSENHRQLFISISGEAQAFEKFISYCRLGSRGPKPGFFKFQIAETFMHRIK